MSIAEKLTTIAENEQKVFDAGKQAGNEEGSRNAISEIVKGSTDLYYFSYKGNRDHLVRLLKYEDTSECTDFQYAFYYTTLSSLPSLDFRKAKNLKNMCYYASELVNVPVFETGEATNIDGTFYRCTKLVSVEIDVSKAENLGSTFAYCNNLTNLNVLGTIPVSIYLAQSKLLTHDSLMSVINALSTTATEKKVTLSSTAVSNAFGSTSSQEWLNLIATKPNWTITLV